MKNITVILLCLTLNTVVVWAEDIHLVETQIQDHYITNGPVDSLTVYVLLLPEHRPLVFNTFDSKPMEDAVGQLPSGSVLIFDGNGVISGPTAAEFNAFGIYCKKKGIVIGPISIN